ncbi:TPA: Rieske 2Fe-2S domain-containing protein [Pseudomonas putida]|jgi:nitrite reductase/ring-hydroxylating ferredoxin subunit|uniref:Rieske (2Fe-2S) protein n=1 Tax=Pseudomonas TaxID=286 RepID=UPI00048108EF|nr:MULTISPECIES: Rieske 2Fe-2S domain-containing protein [Pseudomonas]MDD2149067.1 Rieske 2Fe-2S domain-containing protein [Pseudomonas putida]RAS22720.1 nitrite reductase/ring-hydroxylating ferredoxin subunit [Pseudomonas sp. URMO17WK12:I7]SMF68127.1 Ferredoxin subunit of nitrite reductase or a ring-hydroxylating dioxygenase [Pseudomonas sp. URMO17WK12:I5]HDS1683179.1 Rieske 2Fe-2S domain-containing protein [Pseudomonas putida]
MTRRIALAASQVPERNARVLVESHGKSLAVFNVADTLYAIDDSCPHQGASLCGGRLEGRVIQCCAHGLRFDLASGYLLNSTALKVNSYRVECQGQQVYIVLDDEEGGQ